MSSEENQPASVEAPPESAQSAGAQPAQSAAPSERSGGAGRVLGSFALLFALAAAGLSGWLFYQDRLAPAVQPDTTVAEALSAVEQELDETTGQLTTSLQQQQSASERLNRLEQRVDARQGQLAPLEQGLGRVDERTQGLVRQVEAMEKELADRSAEAADLSRRLEAAIEQLDARGDLQREIDRDLRRQMLMLQAAGLLRIGQDLAEVNGFAREAQRAFERARMRLASIEDARLDQVRTSLAQEIEALASHSEPDLDAELARLARMGRESRNWPLQLPGLKEKSGSAEESEGWRDRLGETLGALVRVETRDSLGRSEEQFEAGREQLRLRLLAAELALMRRNSEALTVQTEAALGLLDEWFDTSAEPVDAARATLQHLAGLDLNPDLPTLGTALGQLQSRLDAP